VGKDIRIEGRRRATVAVTTVAESVGRCVKWADRTVEEATIVVVLKLLLLLLLLLRMKVVVGRVVGTIVKVVGVGLRLGVRAKVEVEELLLGLEHLVVGRGRGGGRGG